MIFQKETLPLAVLGLKRDLRSETDPNGIIYPQEGHGVAQEIRADSYMECSASTGELLDLVLTDIFSLAVKTKSEEGAESDGGCRIMRSASPGQTKFILHPSIRSSCRRSCPAICASATTPAHRSARLLRLPADSHYNAF